MMNRHIRTRGGSYCARATCTLLLVTLLCASVPAPAYGFNLIREFRNGVRGIARVGGHVLQAPEKAVTFVTRPLPRRLRQPVRVLGTIALTRNLLKNPKVADIFGKARSAQRLSDDIQLVTQARQRLRDAYNSEAKRLADQARAIEDQIADIKAQPQAGDVSRIVSLRQLQQNYAQAAEQISDKARRISDADVLKLFAQKSLVPRVLSGAKAVARQKLEEAVGGYVTPSTVARFLRGGITPEAMVELIIAGDARNVVDRRGLPDDFTDDLREALRRRLREDAEFFKKNWRAELDRVVAEVEKEREVRVVQEEGPDEDMGDSAPTGYEGETEGYDTDGQRPEQGGSSAGDADAGVPESSTTWVVWYGRDMGWKPLYIWEKDRFEADTPGNSIEGGGVSDEPIAKVSVGEFATREDAMDYLDGALSNVRTASGIYAGLLIADFQGEPHDIEHIGFDPRDYP